MRPYENLKQLVRLIDDGDHQGVIDLVNAQEASGRKPEGWDLWETARYDAETALNLRKQLNVGIPW